MNRTAPKLPTSSATWQSDRGGDPPLKVENWRLRKYILELRCVTSNSKLLLYTLAEHRKQDTGKCCPGFRTLGMETGLSKRTLTDCVAELMKKRIIGRVDGTGTTGRTSRYFFYFDLPAMLALYEGDEAEMYSSWV